MDASIVRVVIPHIFSFFTRLCHLRTSSLGSGGFQASRSALNILLAEDGRERAVSAVREQAVFAAVEAAERGAAGLRGQREGGSAAESDPMAPICRVRRRGRRDPQHRRSIVSTPMSTTPCRTRKNAPHDPFAVWLDAPLASAVAD